MLFATILVGFISGKTGYLPISTKDAISKVIVNITLPFFIVDSLLSKIITMEMFKGAFVAAIAAVVTIGVMYCVGFLFAKIFKLKEPTKTLYAVLTCFGNVGFLGYPLAYTIYGEEAMFYAVIYGTINNLLFWSAGVYLISKSSGHEKTKDSLKKLFNPNTITFLVCIPLMLLGVKLPELLGNIVKNIGSLTTYLSMIFIGMILATVNIKRLKQCTVMLVSVLLKMIVAPIVAAAILIKLNIPPLVCGAIIMQIAMPAQTVSSIVTNDLGSDAQYSAAYIFVSTLCALFTIPFVCWCFEKII